jgi:hypothetical protein
VWNKLPGTPLTLRAGLLSGRAYRHFVYKDDRIFPEADAQLAVDEAGSSCLSKPYWGYSRPPLSGLCFSGSGVQVPIFISPRWAV